MKYSWVISILLLISNVGFSQKEANVWYFGQHASLDFNSGSAVALTDGALNTLEGCASISDSNGNLQFYTDGSTIWTKNHSVMSNGSGLNGNFSSTQSAIIIPKPDVSNIYYVFTVDYQGEPNGLQYSEIDMALNSGLGAVTSTKNMLLLTPVLEKLTAVKHANGKDIWVICHKNGSAEFYAYLVTSTGVQSTPIITDIGFSYTGSSFSENAGYMKVSPNGKKLAMAFYKFSNGLQLFDFNNSTGQLSNHVNFYEVTGAIQPYGLEFSPSGNILYVSGSSGVSQFDITLPSVFEILLNSTFLNSKITDSDWGALQLAPDGKIYITRAATNNAPEINALSVINNPDILGSGCDFQLNTIPLGTGIAKSGLPPFIQSYFNIGLSYEYNCLGENTLFKLNTPVDSVTWNFGDPISGANNVSTDIEPTHMFTTSGTFTVTATATSGTDVAVSTIDVIISETPTVNALSTIQSCDLDNTNDGVSLIDLTTQNSDLLGSQDPTQFSISYHTTLTDATDGINTILDPQNYLNALSPYTQTIYVRIQNNNNSTCFDTTSFNIEIFDTPYPNTTVSKISTCDTTSFGTEHDGLVKFDLTQKATDILNGQSSTDFILSYFEDTAFTIPIPNPTNYVNTVAGTQNIYVQMTNQLYLDCIASTSFEIEVLEIPTISPIVELKQCDDDLDGYSVFNLEEVKEKISANYLNETIHFYETLADANNDVSTITNTTAYTNQVVSVDNLWARIENNNTCYKTSEVNLVVSATQIPSSFQRDFYKCDDDSDGIVAFDFSSVEADILALLPAGQLPIISYYQNLSDALAETNAISDISNYENKSSPNNQDIYIRVDSDLDNSCLGLGAHISLTVEKVPVANSVTFSDECDPDGDGLFEFDTSTTQSTIVGTQTDVNVFYIAEDGTTLPSPLPNPFQTATQVVTVRVENVLSQDPNGACYDETTISFSVDTAADAHSIANQIECDDDIDSLFPFDTSTIESSVLGSQTGMLVFYTDSDGNSLPSPLPNPFITGNETITVRVENPLNTLCYDETTFKFVVNERPQVELDEEDVICMNNSPTLDIFTFNANGNYSYNWTGPNGFTDTGVSTTVFEGGVYEVIATSVEGCPSFPLQITILESELATITTDMVTIIDDSDNNTISIDERQLGIGNYEYSIDDEFGFYQDDPYFENIPAGIHIIYVRDKYNCGTSMIEISVIGYPKFFTPNNDGENDTWHIMGVNRDFYPNTTIHIYDRFGKIVANISATSNGWDGYYNGNPLPSSDYWFSVQLVSSDGVITHRQGNFSLVRR